MTNDKITSWQYCSLVIMLIISSFFGMSIFSIIKIAGVDSYFSIIISFVLSFGVMYVFKKIFDYEPNVPLPQKVIKLFGKMFGTIINVLLILLALIIGIITMYNLCAFITSQFLQLTPRFIIGIAFSSLVVYLTTKNIKVLGKLNIILVGINIFLFALAVLDLFPNNDYENLKPVLEHGLKKPFIASLYVLSMNYISLFLLLFIPKNTIIDNKRDKKVLITHFLSFVFMTLILITTIGNLGIELASLYEFPEYMVLKRIDFFKFLDRVENVIDIQWIFGLFTTASIVVFFIKSFFKQNKKNNIVIPSVSTLVILVLSLFVFKNSIIFNNFILNYYIYIMLALFLIILIIFIKVLMVCKLQN